jgi:RNA polymerase sigma-70 factor (ECF subfamily)
MADAEQQLIEASRGGDVESFNQLVRLYEGRVYNLSYRILGDADSAADAAQDAFFAAYRNLKSFRGGSFRSWLFRIATNTCYDVLRARKRRPTTSLDAALNAAPDDQEVYMPEPADPGEAPDDAALRHELSRAIEHGLALLPDDQRIVVVLCDVQGMSYNEAAHIVNANLGTVKSRLSRGRARLRDILRAGELLPARYRHEDEPRDRA